MARNKYPEETRRLILDVAQQLLLEKGYDNTSIQDIISGLGGLSKGAVYHHFKSKEEILNAVSDRYNAQVVEELQSIRDDPALSGAEKLKRMFRVSLSSGERDIVYTVAPSLLENPKLLAIQMREIFEQVSPAFVEPVIRQGVADGSIQTAYPKELSEVILLLTNLWMNPLVLEMDLPEIGRKVGFFNFLLQSMGLDLIDPEMMESYLRYCALCHKK